MSLTGRFGVQLQKPRGLDISFVRYLLILLLALISFTVYANSLKGEFLIDDYNAILNNECIHNIRAYFSKCFKIKPGILWELSQSLIWQIKGANPYFYHLFNVLAHAGCVILLFALCQILFSNVTLSFLSSLIFSVHPIHTEAVSWISGGGYAFSSLFFISALIFYIKSAKSLTNLILSIIFFGLCWSLGNTVAALPVLFILYDMFFRNKNELTFKRVRFCALTFMLLVAALFAVNVFILRNKLVHTIFYFRGLSHLIVISKALVYYLKILYLPLARGLYHPFGYNTAYIGKISPAFFSSLFVIAVSMFLFFRCRKSARPLSFGIAWFFITYLPYSNIIPVCNIISERYMYLPSAGFCIILSYLFLKAWEIINKNMLYRRVLRIMAMVIMVLFILSYAALTIKRNFEYKDIITFWETNINNFPDGYLAYNNLAGTYYAMGNPEQAIAYCWVNLMIKADQPHVWCNLGKVYREKGDLEMARHCYQEALKIDKDYPPARKALAEMRK